MKNNIVYHYCNMTTFQSIITNKKIWLSDITKSNDSKELNWIVDFINSSFIDYYKNNASNELKKRLPIRKFKNRLKHHLKDYFDFDGGKNKHYYNMYVACFCNQGDKLSQWRGYADDGRGIAIGFDKNVLCDLRSDFLFGNDVKYDLSSSKAMIENFVKLFFDKIESDIITYNGNELTINLIWSFDKSGLNFYRESVLYKDSYFQEEDEWRLFFHAPNNDRKLHELNTSSFKISDCKYHIRGNELIAHHELDFSPISDKLIKEVILGPKCGLSEKDMRFFLKNYDIKCAVKKSNGSYR